MSQILKSLEIEENSFNGTPETGSGAIFTSGSRLCFENDLGFTSFLGGPGYIRVLEYTGSNPGEGTLTYTWTKPSNINYIQVICVGAGGGGGGGIVRNASIGLSGGAGGGGGATAWGFFNRQDLTQSDYIISVGAGGAGGAGRTFVSSGGTGITGQYTTFGGTLVSASGGSGGAGGGTTTVAGGAGGLATTCLPGPGFAIPGGTGGSGTISANTVPSSYFTTPLIPISTAGGGAGEGRNNSGIAITANTGSSGFEWNTLKLNNSVLSGSGVNDLVTAAVLLQFTSSVITTTYGLGGGGNGAPTIGGISVKGGDGGLFGAGGGGASVYPSSLVGPSQPGGSGSSGLCIVVEYY